MIKKLLKLFVLYVIVGNIIQCRHYTPYVGTVEHNRGIIMSVFTEKCINVLHKRWHRKGDIVMYVRGKLYNYEV